MSGDIKVRLRFEADVAALAVRFPRQFESAAEQRGYAPWEQGSVFLWEVVSDQLEAYLAELPGALVETSGLGPDIEIEFRWTQDQAVALRESLGIEVQ